MPDDIIITLLKDVGIPTAVCFYTLFGVNKTLKKQDETLKVLTDVIKDLGKDVERREVEQSSKIERLEREVHQLSYKVENILQKDVAR